MKLGCFQSNQGLRALDFQTFIQHAADLGYQAIDIPVDNADAAAACDDLGLSVHSAGPAFLPNLSAENGEQEQMIEQMRSAMVTAAAQNVPTITTLVGRAPGADGDTNIALFKEVFTPIAAFAEANNVQLAFENWPRNGTMLATTPELWDAMFNAVPSPAIGLCYDPSHLLWQGIEYIQPIRDFQDRIYHAHAKDTEILPGGRNRYGIYGRQLAATSEQNWWRYRLPGYGEVDWVRYLDTLYQIGYDAVLSVEHEDPVWAETPESALRGLTLARQFLTPLLV